MIFVWQTTFFSMNINLKISKKNIYLNSVCLLPYGYFRACISNYRKYEIRPLKYILGILLLGLIFFTSVSAQPKELATKYAIYMLGANVGEFSVIQKNNNGSIYIEAITDMEIKFLLSYRIKYVQNTVYSQGVLQSSNVNTYKNGKLNSSTWLKFEKGLYLLVADGDTTIINDSITYSGSLLYFNEPTGIKKIYKERSAEMRPINPVSEHVYIVTDDKDRELNKYFYEDGILWYAQMRHALGTFELKRKTNKKGND